MILVWAFSTLVAAYVSFTLRKMLTSGVVVAIDCFLGWEISCVLPYVDSILWLIWLFYFDMIFNFLIISSFWIDRGGY